MIFFTCASRVPYSHFCFGTHILNLSESQDSKSYSGKFCNGRNDFLVGFTLYSSSESWTLRYKIVNKSLYSTTKKTDLVTKTEYFEPRKTLPLLDQDLPPKNCRSPTLCPRKYHMYAKVRHDKKIESVSAEWVSLKADEKQCLGLMVIGMRSSWLYFWKS